MPAKCELCGEPMPPGEEVFNYHGYSGPCPKPPLPKNEPTARQKVRDAVLALIRAKIEATTGDGFGGRGMLYLGTGPTGRDFAVTLTFGYGYFDGDCVMIHKGEEIVPCPDNTLHPGRDQEGPPEAAAD